MLQDKALWTKKSGTHALTYCMHLSKAAMKSLYSKPNYCNSKLKKKKRLTMVQCWFRKRIFWSRVQKSLKALTVVKFNK